MDLSNRTKNLGVENAFTVLNEVEELQRKGKEIISFCIGQPDFDTPENIKKAAIKAINEGKTGYTPSNGILKVREAIASYLSKTRHITVKPQSIVVANGAKPFIGYVILSVTDFGKGHEVLYPNPGFPIYESQIRAHGAVPIAMPLLERKDYSFDIDYLKSRINDRTRLLILNSPHNPTGGVLDKERLKQVADIVMKHDNLWVFSDEVYSNLSYDSEFTSIASIPGMQSRTIIVDTVSKTYAMPGWRIGFAANERLAKHLSRWVNNTDSCAGHPNQYAALEAYSGPQDKPNEMKESFRLRRDLIFEGLNAIEGIKFSRPKGAFYAWANVSEACEMVGAKDSEDFRIRLLHDAGVAVLSDIHFGDRNEGEGEHIRLSYATSKENIRKGLKRISDYIKDNKSANS